MGVVGEVRARDDGFVAFVRRWNVLPFRLEEALSAIRTRAEGLPEEQRKHFLDVVQDVLLAESPEQIAVRQALQLEGTWTQFLCSGEAREGSGRPRQLFLDCDGVLADFDLYAEEIFGLPPRKAEATLGTERFWCDLQSHPDFYNRLPLMTDAVELYEAVRHLDPVILTGLPLGDWAEPQKRRWGVRHFPGVRMICCMSKDKRQHMQPGDVLVDDWPKYRSLWEEAGGIFILHTSAAESIRQLREAGVLA